MRASVAETVAGESGQVFGDSAAIREFARSVDMAGSVGAVGDCCGCRVELCPPAQEQSRIATQTAAAAAATVGRRRSLLRLVS